MSPESFSPPASKIATIAFATTALTSQVIIPAHASEGEGTFPSHTEVRTPSRVAEASDGSTPTPSDVQEAEAQVAAAERDLQTATSAHQDAVAETSALNEALHYDEEAVAAVEQERDEARDVLAQRIAAEQGALNEAVNAARSSTNHEREALANATQEAEALRRQAEAAAAQQARASEDLATARNEVEAAATPEDRRNGNELPSEEGLRERIDAVSEQIAELDRTIEQATAERDDLQRRHTELASQVDTTTEAAASAQARLQEATQRHDTAQQALQQAEESLATRREELERITDEAGPDSEAYRQATENLTQAEQDRAQASIDLESLTQELADRQREMEQAQEHLEAQNAVVAEKENTLAQVTQQINTCEDALATASSNRQEKQEELANLNSQLDEVRSRLAAEEAIEAVPEYELSDVVNREVLTQGLALFRDNAGTVERVAELASAPDDLSQYFLRSTLPDGRELSMPVSSIVENTQGDTPVFTVHATVPGGFSHIPTVTLSVPKTDLQAPTVYRTFASLVEAMNSNPDGTFRVGADLQVDSTDVAQGAAYVTATFTGTLDGQGHTISGLLKPLFSSLGSGAQVSNLSLANVKLNSSDDHTAALAQRAEGQNTQVRQVRVQGRIEGEKYVGAVVAEARNVTFESVFFDGRLYSNWRRDGGASGGLVGMMSGGSLMEAGAQATIEIAFRRDTNTLGGLVGLLTDGARLSQSYVGGVLRNGRGRGRVGGIVGSVRSESGQAGVVDTVVSGMAVTGGRVGHGDAVDAQMRNVTYIDGEASGTPDAHPSGSQVDATQAQAAYEALKLTYHVRPNSGQASSPDSSAAPAAGASSNPYASVAEARSERLQAYKNYALLMPLASREVIVRAANMLGDGDPLVTKILRSALPTVGGQIAFGPLKAGQVIDGVFLHYADHSVERRAVRPHDEASAGASPVPSPSGGAPVGNTQGGAFVLYRMAGGLPYAPVQLATPSQALVAQIRDELLAVAFDSIDMSTLVDTAKWQAVFSKHKGSDAEKKSAASDELRGLLYLRTTFEQQRDSLGEVLEKLIAQERTTATAQGSEGALKRKISENKEAFLLGLAYVNKWYNIDFGSVNLRDLLVFRQDFFGSRQSPIDWLIKLGKDYYHLDPQKNTETLVKYVSPYARHVDVVELLESTRQQFTTTRDFDEWFRNTTKAHLMEIPSLQLPDYGVRVSDRFKGTKYKGFLLPLLTVSADSMFVMVHMTSVTMGSFERYYDARNLSAEQIDAKVAQIKNTLQYYAERYRDYYDLWYRISSEKARAFLLNDIPVWEGYSTQAGWSPQYGPQAMRTVEEFFGPIRRWYGFQPVGAYSSGDATHMVITPLLDPYGLALFTHEMVHNLDRYVFMGGESRRIYALPEMYPVSLLQNPTYRSSTAFGFNQAADFRQQNGQYLHNAHPERFQTMVDLEQYFKGYFNALYLLDNAEAEAMLSQNSDALAKMLMRLGNHDHPGVTVNSYDALTADDIAQLNLRSMNDLIDHSLMMRRANQPSNGEITRNGYPNVTVLDPIYGTGESPVGLPGESVFRRNSLELLAAKGFEGGFVPYTSARLLAEARRTGHADMPDTFVMAKIFEADPYSTLKDHRKQAYEKIKERAASHLRPITVSYDGRSETYTTYDQLLARFRELMVDDIQHGRHGTTHAKVYQFKAEVLSELMRQTDEFKSSMFTDDIDQLVPWKLLDKPQASVQQTPPAPQQPALDVSAARFSVVPLVSRDEGLIAQLREQVQTATQRAQDAQESARVAESEVVALEGKLRALRDRRDENNGALSEARVGAVSAQTALQRAVEGYRLVRDRRMARETEIQQLEARAQGLRADIEALTQRVEGQQSLVDQALRIQQERFSSAEQAQQRLMQAREEYAAADRAVAEVQKSLADVVEYLRGVETRVSDSAQRRRDRDREGARLRALRGLVVAYEAARQLSDAAELRHVVVRDRLVRAEQTIERAQARVDDLTRALAELENRHRRVASLSVEALLAGAQVDDTPGIVEGVTTLRRVVETLSAAVERRDSARDAVRRHGLRLVQLDQARVEAQAAVVRARAELERVRAAAQQSQGDQSQNGQPQQDHSQGGNEVHTRVPSDAPVVELPVYPIGVVPLDAPVVELPVHPIGVVPDQAPVAPELPVAPLSGFTAPQVTPKVRESSSTKDQSSVRSSAGASLANTGANSTTLGVLAALAGVLGLGALRGRRRDVESQR